MSTPAFEILRQLYEEGLYDDFEALCPLLITVDRNCDSIFSSAQHYQTLIWYGDVLLASKQYRKAELMFEKALQLRRSAIRKRQQDQDVTPQTDVQFRIFECLMGRKELKLAISTLESIPQKQRSTRVNMTLAKLYHGQGNDRAAILCYKEVLRANPYALAAINALLELNVKTTGVASLMASKGVHGTMEWMQAYIAATGELFARNLPKALLAFEALDQSLQLKGNYDINMMIAKINYFQGDDVKALNAFERAVKADKFQIQGMDLYAALLYKEKKVKELEQLSSHLATLSEYHAETYISLGYQCYIRQKYTRAQCMCNKALELSPRNVEAILLKAQIVASHGVRQMAVSIYNEAQTIAPYRFEPYIGQVTLYLAENRLPDAHIAAANATRQLGQTARTLTLRADVLMKNPGQQDKAKTYLERALVHGPAYLPAIYSLAEIYESTRNYEAGVQLLQEKLQLVGSTPKLHRLLGEFLHKVHEPEQALFHFGVALNLDPNNPQVKKGIQMVEQSVGGEQSYEMEMEDDRESEVNNEDSDVDGVWSDEF
ncbi:anaphase-promoting complex subunit 7-like [Tropilaelaps mercedesae]|uniref:Anaphase-promoting complex subunit 7-like n=1 Tax=Tropilaelaps mercedesae TaxID=418985 RepID=A0A1V9XC64_9ACAR|nr:anaphase-promoting complex subunit 7-like [Tropilaelaps mercedesae]